MGQALLILGQDHFLERLAVALLARGHILIEGELDPGDIAAVKTLAKACG